MKNSKKILAWLLLFSTLLGACSKKFLDLPPYSSVPLDQAILDQNSMQTAANGMYAGLRATDAFGRSIPIDGDLMADNIYISASNSNRYIPELTYTYIPIYSNQQNMWAQLYAVILRANNIINAKIPTNAAVNQLVGEALTIRALCYFELVKFYAKPFVMDPSSPGVPLVLKYDPHLTPARNTVLEVYTQIENDLTKAFGLMTIGKNTSFVTKYVAEGLLARLYLFEGQWSKAQSAALNVVDSSGYTMVPGSALLSYWASPSVRSDGIETLFEVEFDAVDNNSSDGLDAFYDQNGYGDALCTDDLISRYTLTDARQALILSGSRGGASVLVVNKYPNLINPSGKDNTKILRISEVLLTLAETYNRLGDDVNAKKYIDTLAQNRDPSFAGYNDTGAGMLNDIILERRKELAFEGHRYWDLARLNLDVIRNDSTGNYLPSVPLILPASSTKRIFPIPQAELNANKNMVQNPGY